MTTDVVEPSTRVVEADDTAVPDRDLVGTYLHEISRTPLLNAAQEVELAKAEVKESGTKAGKGVGMLAGAAMAGLMALITLTLLLIVIFDAFLELWLAALIVLVIWAALAAGLGLTGKKKLQEAAPPVPEQTTQTLKEDVQWAKNPTQSART